MAFDSIAAQIEEAIYECLTRSSAVKTNDLPDILNSLADRLKAKAEIAAMQPGPSDEDLLDDE